jgi:hypothetical protein
VSTRRIGWSGAAYLLLLLVALGVMVIWWPELTRVWRDHFLTFLVATLLMAFALLVQAKNFISFSDGASAINHWQFWRVWALSALANYAGPLQPGIALRVIYLQRHGVPVSGSLLAMWRQLSVSVWLSIAGLALGLLLTDADDADWAAGLLFLGFVSLYASRPALVRRLNQMRRPYWLAEKRPMLVKALSGTSPRGVAGVALQYVLGTLLLYWSYSRFGTDVSLGKALLLACAVYVSNLVAILPGNFGITEGIYLLGGHDMGLPIQEAAALALLLRGSHVAACLIVSAAGPIPLRRP